MEIVTPERTLGIEVGGMNHVPYARAFNETDTRVTLNQGVLAVCPERGRWCVEIGSDHSAHRAVRHVDAVIVDDGTTASDALYHALVAGSTNLGALDVPALLAGRPQTVLANPTGAFQLFRIGECRFRPQRPRRRPRRAPSRQGPVTDVDGADAVVIGAGVIGAVVGLELSRGALRAQLVGRRTVAVPGISTVPSPSSAHTSSPTTSPSRVRTTPRNV